MGNIFRSKSSPVKQNQHYSQRHSLLRFETQKSGKSFASSRRLAITNHSDKNSSSALLAQDTIRSQRVYDRIISLKMHTDVEKPNADSMKVLKDMTTYYVFF
jgi:hypothetical protein